MSLKIDEGLRKRLQQYVLDKKGRMYGMSEVINEVMDKFLSKEGY